MHEHDENIKRFLAMTELYFRLTEKSILEVSVPELEEFLDAINGNPPCLPPEQGIGQSN